MHMCSHPLLATSCSVVCRFQVSEFSHIGHGILTLHEIAPIIYDISALVHFHAGAVSAQTAGW